MAQRSVAHATRGRFIAALAALTCAAGFGLAQGRPAIQRRMPATLTGPATRYAPPPGARVVPHGWFAPQPVKRPELPAEVTRAFVIPIHGEITGATYEIIQQKVIRARTGRAQLIIFDLDTPGGSGQAMREIFRHLIDKLPQDIPDVYTVAYVNPEAFSAGAIIALACNDIVMTPTAVIGDAMPIMAGPGGLVEIPPDERGKFESATRADVRVLAGRNGYNETLCQAMITITIEAWLIRNRETGELMAVYADEWRNKLRNPPASTQPSVADAASPWEYLSTIDGPRELLTMTADEAAYLGFCKHILPSMDDLRKQYHIVSPPVTLEDTWSEGLVGFLAQPAVTGILMFIAMVGIYMEFSAPGHILPGVAAVVCLAIVFGSHYLIGMAQWWMIALFVLGLVLMAVDLFVTPGLGVLITLGGICCVVGLVAMLGGYPLPRTSFDWKILGDGLLALLLAFIAATGCIAFLAKYLQRVPVFGRLILSAPSAPTAPPVPEGSPLLHLRPGAVGVVEAVCRPVGKVRFGDDLLDASSEGAVIENGRKVRVLQNDGNHLIVEEIPS